MVSCWFCDCEVLTPIQRPVGYNERTGQFTTEGAFCSWECIKTFIRDCLPYNKPKALSLMRLAYCIAGNLPDTQIPCRPSRYRRKAYGGDLSEDAYRSTKSTFVSLPPHMIEVAHVIDPVQVLEGKGTPSQVQSGGLALPTPTPRAKRKAPPSRDVLSMMKM